ncbi:copper-translocating P-type ATPase [Leuconostoc gelidum]|uniref:copper-translocating P-type ATPase n=1 Tax=Leuconostoc gelidum TaxID=1244 RepID=UPI001C7E06AD|nr:copper-translocating P-type ATPase [Leuconostoc gelidum]MBZ6009901.1 copper-translocating P-type ATPase [Leuconostoc gelidum subsp. aenigmaticum]
MKMTEHSHHDMADMPMTENMADHDMSQHHMHMTADPGMANMDMTDMKRRFWWSFGLMIPIIIITPFMGLSLPFTLTFPGSNWVTAILSVLLYFIGSKPFFDGAKSEIKAKKPAMMSLVSMGLLVTFWYSIYALLANQFVHGTHIMDFFWEFATLTVIMLLGHRIEMATTMKAGDATDKLRSLMPNIAHVRHGDMMMDMPLHTLKPGMIVQVLAGEAFPADGVVITGHSQVDESLMTGESQLIDKSENSPVVGGTINGNGSLDLRLTQVGSNSFVGQLQGVLATSQDQKSRVETLADRVASYLFWLALIFALVALIVWTSLRGLSAAINIAVTVLVIACPHALGLAVPLVIQRTKSVAAAQGILIKNRQALTGANHLQFALIDKTGTLTTGKFSINRIVTYGLDETQAVAIMSALDSQSTHPLAQSITAYGRQIQVPQLRAENVTNLAGYGVSGNVNDVHYLLVSERFLSEKHILFTPLHDEGSISYLLKHDQIVAAISQGDTVRDTASEFVKHLVQLGITPVLVTGDNIKAAQNVAAQLDINAIHAQVSPQEKIAQVIKYQQLGDVMMIGDGINDAPALAQANLSIAIGAGTQVAQAAADAVLIANQLPKIIDFLQLIKRAHTKQIQNLWWGAGYNIIAIPLAAGVLSAIGLMLNPMIGAIVMSLSTIIVTLNAMTLKASPTKK